MGGATSKRRRFPEISPTAFQHPLDRTALSTLRKAAGLDWLIKNFFTVIGEKRLRLLFLASAVRVNARQFPEIHSIYLEACRTLDIADPPELFVTQKFFVNAAAIGARKPFIVLTSSLVDMLNEDELTFVLGHELGHVMCGHSLYTTLLLLLIGAWYALVGVPGGAYAVLAIRMALLEWSRKAELTGDRAGLLVTQDIEVSQRVNMKLAGGRRADQMDLEEFHRQAAEYQEGGSLLDGIIKLVTLLGQTHPFPVLRVSEIEKFAASAEYARILAGDYPRRRDERNRPWMKDLKDAATSYRDGAVATADPLLRALRDFGNSAASAGAGLVDTIRRAVRGNKGSAPEPRQEERPSETVAAKPRARRRVKKPVVKNARAAKASGPRRTARKRNGKA
ncbi:MAG: M48 family metallopeptidase [Acidobacteriota bacterium]